MPGEGFDTTSSLSLYTAGFGIRKPNLCITDSTGPETHNYCGSPKYCTRDSSVNTCGLEFLHGGVLHRQCLTTATPAASDPVCARLHANVRDQTLKVNHIFDRVGRHVTTCYPSYPPGNSKGWCSTRDITSDIDSEPTPMSGWGFCSGAQEQSECNAIGIGYNTTAEEVHYMDRLTCANTLYDWETFGRKKKPPFEEYREEYEARGLICTGRVSKRDWSKENFFQQIDGQRFHRLEVTEQLIRSAVDSGTIYEYTVEGGPNCHGDEGGPLFRVANFRPVLVGIFSFVPWGKCTGKEDLAFHMDIKYHMAWLARYAAEDGWCLQK